MQELLKQDTVRMEKALALIAEHSDLSLNLKSVTTDKFSITKVWKWLTESEVTEDDCLFIYFTGNAYCLDKEISPWPSLCFKRKKEVLDFEQLEKALDYLKPRLSIVLYDSSNDDFKNDPSLSSQDLKVRLDWADSRDIEELSLESLFTHSRGKVFLVAANPGETKYWDEKGSIFTRLFLNSVQFVASQDNPSWEKVIHTLKQKYSPLKLTPLTDVDTQINQQSLR
jgi:hypothetical protein